MTLSIVDKALLRRLIVGDLRSDGVTDYQRHCLAELAANGFARRFAAGFSITPAGRDKLALAEAMQPE